MEKIQERAQALVNAPASVASRSELLSTHEINAAIQRNLQGSGNYGVYCIVGEQIYRVYAARLRQGERQMKVQNGCWVKPQTVYVEG